MESTLGERVAVVVVGECRGGAGGHFVGSIVAVTACGGSEAVANLVVGIAFCRSARPALKHDLEGLRRPLAPLFA